jgi:hypothetical protein
MASPNIVYDVVSQTQISLDASSTVDDAATPDGATGCVLAARSQNVWVSFNGNDPSSTNGVTIIAGAQPVFLPVIPTLASDDTRNDLLAVSSVASTAKLDIIWVNWLR